MFEVRIQWDKIIRDDKHSRIHHLNWDATSQQKNMAKLVTSNNWMDANKMWPSIPLCNIHPRKHLTGMHERICENVLCNIICSSSLHACLWMGKENVVNRMLWRVRSNSQFSRSVLSNSLQPHGLQHARFLCPSPTLGVCSNSSPLIQWCHPTISSSVIPFSCLLQSFPASGLFQMNQFFASGGESIGVLPSASVLPVNIQGWLPLGRTGWVSSDLPV